MRFALCRLINPTLIAKYANQNDEKIYYLLLILKVLFNLAYGYLLMYYLDLNLLFFYFAWLKFTND